MKEKCFAGLLSADVPFKIVRAKYDLDNRLLAFRVGFNIPLLFTSPSEAVPVPLGVRPYPFKRGRGIALLFLVDTANKVGCNHGQCIGDIDAQLRSKITSLCDNWFYKSMGKRKMDIVELLITLGAGYGFFRFAEYFLTSLFAR